MSHDSYHVSDRPPVFAGHSITRQLQSWVCRWVFWRYSRHDKHSRRLHCTSCSLCTRARTHMHSTYSVLAF